MENRQVTVTGSQMAVLGRQVAVIGGSTGIGLETARLLADKGAQVTIGGRNRDRLDGAAKELGGRVQAMPVDAERVDSLTQFFAQAGSITLVTAGSAQSALPGTAGLAAVNGALEAAVAPLAAELAPRRVNAVSPGVIETGWWDELPDDARQEAFTSFAQRALVRRNGRPQDVAHAIVALIENRFITGVVLPCDGGLRLT